jgi:choline dehydrogenase-like flavoprotein
MLNRCWAVMCKQGSCKIAHVNSKASKGQILDTTQHEYTHPRLINRIHVTPGKYDGGRLVHFISLVREMFV